MDDPNAIYKTGFAELVVKLGRTPTMKDAELLGLHEEYKKSWEPATETVLAPVSAAGPSAAGFSREPAPQARTGGEDARTREGQEATGAPNKPAEPEEAVTAPLPSPAPSRVSEQATVGTRGPGGGIVAACRKCGQAFERPTRKGRPPVECGICRY